jgi:hypothetical protein
MDRIDEIQIGDGNSNLILTKSFRIEWSMIWIQD